jgi:hypothetical protein
MPSHLSHSNYWRLQAQEARLTAQRLEDPEAKAAMLKKADEYDRLAACNSAWEAELRSAAKKSRISAKTPKALRNVTLKPICADQPVGLAASIPAVAVIAVRSTSTCCIENSM